MLVILLCFMSISCVNQITKDQKIIKSLEIISENKGFILNKNIEYTNEFKKSLKIF